MRRTMSLTLTEKLLRFLISIYSSPVSITPLPGVESNCTPLLSLQSLCGSVTISSMRSLIELIRLPVHTPLMHVSLNVAGFPSSQALLLFVFVHPLIESQASSVHILPSSQKSGAPDVHIPPLQTSIVVQTFPSSQRLLLFVFVHPLTKSQASSVHILPSSQEIGMPDVHTPSLQTSIKVQAFPSSQGLLLFVNVHPLTESHVSSVHTLPSLQKLGAPDVHTPSLQMSPKVQASPSSQGLLLFVNVHPLTESHVSSVHTFPSLQELGAPDVHTPSLQMSTKVQAFPSSQGAILFVFVHPLTESQASSVHILPSSQGIGAPDVHTPLLQVSNEVQTFPSSQRLLLFVYLHPVRRSHVSSVHTLPSSQLLGHSEEHSAHGFVVVHPFTYLA